MYKYISDYESRTDLKAFGPNALMLYALQLRFDIEDIATVAAESITDGHKDKKCDMIYLDSDEEVAVIAQAYYKTNFHLGEHAKLTKAQDLNTTASWIFGRSIDDIPEILKSSVSALQTAINNNKISTIYFWYQHNCDENPEIQEELNTVANTATTLIKKTHPNSQVKVIGLEIGNQTLEKWYESTTNKILVDDEIDIALPFGSYEISEANWSACQAYISGQQLYSLYKQYGDDLFSANPRRFLGTGRKSHIINFGIRESAQQSADNFWAYNNGITALVHEYSYVNHNELKIRGISIINGAQTTGSIGTLKEPPSDKLYVSLRVIKCTDRNTISAIIANNNRQNEMVPSDFRSNDVCQTRLRKEFEEYPALYYNGGQRSGNRPRTREVFDPDTVAQTLLAFNGNPVDAYSSRKDIWDNDSLYASVFNDDIHAEHIIFVYALSKAIDEIKAELQAKARNSSILDEENNELIFLCKRGSRILLLSAISQSLEIILQKPISNTNDLRFDDNSDFDLCKEWWKPIVTTILPFYSVLDSALSAGGLASKAKAEKSILQIKSFITAIIKTIGPSLQEVRNHTKS